MRIAAMQPFDNCAACACMQAWRLAASWITELQSLWASPVQAARTAAVAAGAGWMAAHSPQAKGRIERFFGTAQDRLVKGLRKAGARS